MRRPAIALGLLLLAGGAALFEAWRNARGPFPGPDASSAASGRALLGEVVAHHGGRALDGRDAVRFRVLAQTPFRAPLVASVALDPASRSADLVVREGEEASLRSPSGGPGGAFRYDGARETVTPAATGGADPRLGARLRSLAPSLVFWSLVPWILDDPGAAVWRLPDARREGRTVRRVAVRWPGETDWFALDLDGEEPRLLGLTFVDARATVLLRWEGRPDGMQSIDGAGFPRAWRFRPAHPVLRLAGDLFVFRYGPIV